MGGPGLGCRLPFISTPPSQISSHALFLDLGKFLRSLGAQLCTILYCVSECITPWQDILQGLGSVIIVGVDAVCVHNVGHI